MSKYRKKPIVIEAVQFMGTKESFDKLDAIGFKREHWGDELTDLCTCGINIKTLKGDELVLKGDWIIRGVNGDYYPCKADVFEETYEMVE